MLDDNGQCGDPFCLCQQRKVEKQPMTSAVGDAAALTDRQALAEFIGRANRPNLSPGGRLAETDSWLGLADALLSSDWLAGYVTTARAQAVREAAAAIQALHPGEVKASVEFLKERASFIDGSGCIDLDEYRSTEDA